MTENETTRSSERHSGFDIWTELIIPLLIPLAVTAFGVLQFFSQKHVEDQRAQQATLQAYLDYMDNLLLQEKLRKSSEKGNVRLLARARTLNVLDAVTGERKVRVLEFLYETKLTQSDSPNEPPIISLNFANLRGAPLGNRFILNKTN